MSGKINTLNGAWGAVGAGLGMTSNIATSYIDRQTAKQNAELQYKYGEMAADNAQNRALAMYDYQFNKNTPKEQRRMLEEAGLSASLMYGGGGVSGAGSMASAEGAQGTGANVQQTNAKGLDPLVLLQGQALSTQIEKTKQEIKNMEIQGEKQKEETRSIKWETDFKESMKETLKRTMGAEADSKELFYVKELWQAQGVEDEDFVYKAEDGRTIKINANSPMAKKAVADLSEQAARTILAEAQAGKEVNQAALLVSEKMLKDQEVKHYVDELVIKWRLLKVQEMNASTNAFNAETNRMHEFNWTDIETQKLDAIIDSGKLEKLKLTIEGIKAMLSAISAAGQIAALL